MKARLIKRIDNGWPVYSLRREDGRLIATTRWPFDEPSLMIAKKAGIELQKLSHENCDEIFGVVDVEKLAQDYAKSQCEDLHDELGKTGAEWGWETALDFKNGFNKAIELSKDKQFTLEDMKRAISFGQGMDLWKEEEQIDKFIHSCQQPTEIEVEIEMVKLEAGIDSNGKPFIPETFPKLDSKGCLILQKSNKEE